ncbi:MAG: hypothetical protein PHR30_18690 [Gallionellaceae bacterium]|nr:hypothetical protein [Gallionellaceae bacterium]
MLEVLDKEFQRQERSHSSEFELNLMAFGTIWHVKDHAIIKTIILLHRDTLLAEIRRLEDEIRALVIESVNDGDVAE